MLRLASLLAPIVLAGVFAATACDKKADPPAEPVAVAGAELAQAPGEGEPSAPAAEEATPTQGGEAVAAAGAGAKACPCKGGEGCDCGDCGGEGACDCADKGCCEGKGAAAGGSCAGKAEGGCGGCAKEAGHGHAGHDHAGHDHAGAGACGGKAEGGCGGCAKKAAHAHGGEAHEGCAGLAQAAPAPEPVAHAHAHEGCGGHGQLAAAPSDAAPTFDPATAKHFGEAFALTEAKPLAAVLGEQPEGVEEPVQISGVIEQVCQTKGCWMVVRDGEREARVVMKGYSFFVPKDAKGKATVVEGTIAVKTVTEAHAKHLAEDAGEDPAAVTGDRKEYTVTASAIAIGG